MKCNLDKVVSISGGLGEPPAVGGFQKVSPAKDRRHCKSVRVTFHGEVGSEERGRRWGKQEVRVKMDDDDV